MKSIDDIRRENIALLEQEAGSQRALAEKLERSESQISQWKNGAMNSGTGKPRGMRTDTARYIEQRVGKPQGWLDADHSLGVLPKPVQYLMREVPVVGTAKLGDDGHFCPLEYPVGQGDGCLDWPTRDPNAYGLKCRGESMRPRIRHGEFVIVEPNHAYVPGDEVVVRSHDERVMVKQWAFTRDGMVYLDSVNETFPRISIPIEEVAEMHYVAGIAKSALWREMCRHH